MLREHVHKIVARIPWVISSSLADPADGGWGATVVKLAPSDGT